MASPAVTYTFSPSTLAQSAQVNQNFTDLINGMTDGTKTFNIAILTLTNALGAASGGTGINTSSSTGLPFVTNGVWSVYSAGAYVMTSVKDFGAKGDGVTDDTTALTNAINSGNPLFWPAGTYVISGSLTASSTNGLYWRGTGVSTVLVNKAGSSKPSIVISDVQYFFIDGITVLGTTSHPNDAILLTTSGGQTTAFGSISNCVLEPNGNGITLVKVNTIAFNNIDYLSSFSGQNTQKYGVLVDSSVSGQYANAVYFTNCTLNGVDNTISGHACIKMGAAFGNLWNVVIEECELEGSGLTALDITNATLLSIKDTYLDNTSSTLTACANCMIDSCVDPLTISLAGTCRQVVLRNIYQSRNTSSTTIGASCTTCGTENCNLYTLNDSGTRSRHLNLLINGSSQQDTLGSGFVVPNSLTVNTSGTVQLPGLTASQVVVTDVSKNLTSLATTGSGNAVLATSPTLTTPVISSIVNTGTLTLPTSTDTLVGRATTDTLTNKTLSSPTLSGTITTGLTATRLVATNGSSQLTVQVYNPASSANSIVQRDASSNITTASFITNTANAASAGVLRLADTDAIKWRNHANSADVTLSKDTSDQLSYGGTSFLSSAGVLLSAGFPALTGDVTSSAGSLATTAAATQANITTLSNSSGVAVHGTNTNNSASAGYVGEYVSSNVVRASAVSLTDSTATNVTSIALTAGDWDVSCLCTFLGAGCTMTVQEVGLSTTTGSLTGTTRGLDDAISEIPTTTANFDFTVAIPCARFSLSGSTTIFMVASPNFSAGTLKAYGSLHARRVR